MVETEAFRSAYARLNPKQKEAVDTIYGPVLVIAGPGTGKTQILALRIGVILQQSTGTKPDEVCALTFTESAVATLRTRLAGLIGATAYRVRIHTFHGFAHSILMLRPDLFPRIVLGAQLSDVSGAALMETLLDAGSYERIRKPKQPYRTAKELLGFMGKLKQERYTPKRYLAELTDERARLLALPDRVHVSGRYAGQEKAAHLQARERTEKHLEVAHLFGAYEEALRKESLYDYEDLIIEAVRGLETDEGFRAQVGERSQFVLADEHQDANPAQNRLLELVTDFDGAPNLFVVGDEKQAIYRFQGASLESFFYLKGKYPDAKVILLDENYRSTDKLLAAAHDLIALAPVPDPVLRPRLHALRGPGAQPAVLACATPRTEHDAIIAHCFALYAQGVPYEDIAILTRKNADVREIALSLRSAHMPEDHASANDNALAHPSVRVFLSLVQAALDCSQDTSLARAFFTPGLPGSLSERQRLLAALRRGRSLFETAYEHGSDALRAWLQNLARLSEEMPATSLVVWLVRLAQESGFLSGILALGESEDAYEAYQGLMDEAILLSRENPGATALDFVRRLALIERHALRVKRPHTHHAGVRVMTAHSAKGLEFPYVIIAHATDEGWLQGRTDEFSLPSEPEDDEQDARRLFYVALTRARDSVLVTWSAVTAEDRPQTPLRFLSDITAHLVEAPTPMRVPPPTAFKLRTVLDTDFLRERLLVTGFSPTGFNHFFASPWQYYFRTLLRIPDAPAPAMLFGTAVHAGLRTYAEMLKEGPEAALSAAFTALRSSLERSALASSDKQRFVMEGETALRAYGAQQTASLAFVQETEYAIQTFLSVPGVGEVPLTGILDRLDLKNSFVDVIDYKTGKARSENDIRGLTKAGDGSYYRQLVFYKLLLEKEGRYAPRAAALHFVEPNGKGLCIVREFGIPDTDVRALETALVAAAQAVTDGSAFIAACNPTLCDYCDLAELLAAR